MKSSQSPGTFSPSWEEVYADSAARAETEPNTQELITTERHKLRRYKVGLGMNTFNCLAWGYSIGAGQENVPRPVVLAALVLGMAGTVISGTGIGQASDAIRRLQAQAQE